jgi:hypothetical protein
MTECGTRDVTDANNNTRAGGIKACSTAWQGYYCRRAFIPKACGRQRRTNGSEAFRS